MRNKNGLKRSFEKFYTSLRNTERFHKKKCIHALINIKSHGINIYKDKKDTEVLLKIVNRTLLLEYSGKTHFLAKYFEMSKKPSFQKDFFGEKYYLDRCDDLPF